MSLVTALGHGGGGEEKTTKAVWKALETLLRGAGHGTSDGRTNR